MITESKQETLMLKPKGVDALALTGSITLVKNGLIRWEEYYTIIKKVN